MCNNDLICFQSCQFCIFSSDNYCLSGQCSNILQSNVYSFDSSIVSVICSSSETTLKYRSHQMRFHIQKITDWLEYCKILFTLWKSTLLDYRKFYFNIFYFLSCRNFLKNMLKYYLKFFSLNMGFDFSSLNFAYV